MINYLEKGQGLHAKIVASGFNLECRYHSVKADSKNEENIESDEWITQEEWLSSNDEAVQKIINDYSLAEAIDYQCKLIDDHATNQRNQLIANISPGEMASWAIKRQEAESWLESKNDESAPFLSGEAKIRGISLETLVSRILVNARSYTEMENHIAGMAGFHKDNLRKMENFDDLFQYDWKTNWPIQSNHRANS